MKINSFLVFALLLVSYTLAIDTSQHETTTQKTKEAEDMVQPAYGGGGWQGGGGGSGGGWQGGGGGGRCRHGCCYQGHYGCNRCCTSPEEAKAFAQTQAKAATDKVEKETKGSTDKVEPAYGGGGGGWQGGGGGSGGGWQGGGGGGGCRHGCCGAHGYRGCQRCCASPEEAKTFIEKQEKAATDKVEKETKGSTDRVEPAYGGGGGWQGGGGGSGGGWQGGGGGSGGGWQGGGGCRYGCCYQGHRGSCQRCCASPEEAKAVAEKQGAKRATDKVEPTYGGGGGSGGGGWQGGGGGGWQGGGGGCRHGCCYSGRYGCNRCCSSPEEAKVFVEKLGHP